MISLRLRHRVGQQNGACQLVVLRLTQQVGRNIGRVRGVVRDDQNLGRACDHVNVNRAEGELFRRRNESVARADDFIHLRNEARAVGQRRDSLRAADGDHGVYARDFRRRKHLVRHIFGRGRDHDELADTGDLGRDGVHEHRGRIRRRAARHIDADSREAAHGLAEDLARRALPFPRFYEHLLVVVADVRRRLFERRNQLGVAGIVRLIENALLDDVRRLAVELFRIFHDCVPAAFLYVSHHAAHDLFNIAARTCRTRLHLADNSLLRRSVR